MSVRAAVAVGALVASVALPGAWGARSALAAPADCQIKPGVASAGVPWAQTRLDFQRAWTVTAGRGVTVGVVDTGLDVSHPQLQGVHVRQGVDVVDAHESSSTVDCEGHGTMVTAIIAAQHVDGEAFTGVAPDATVVPIKQTASSQKPGTADGLARGIEAALHRHVQVINLSVVVQEPTPALEQAVRDAARADVVIVAAAGNFATQGNPVTYPAAYSTKYPNVIAVGAVDDHDRVWQNSEHGSYIDVVAPGVGVETPSAIRGYQNNDGTSFATPYVTGVVALVRSADPHLTAAEVRGRLETTADAPPASVPDPFYGYGEVNPYLAVTAVRDDAPPASATRPARPLPAPAAPAPPDRHLQHLALGLAAGLLGLAVLTAVAAFVFRGAGRRPVT